MGRFGNFSATVSSLLKGVHSTLPDHSIKYLVTCYCNQFMLLFQALLHIMVHFKKLHAFIKKEILLMLGKSMR